MRCRELLHAPRSRMMGNDGVQSFLRVDRDRELVAGVGPAARRDRNEPPAPTTPNQTQSYPITPSVSTNSSGVRSNFKVPSQGTELSKTHLQPRGGAPRRSMGQAPHQAVRHNRGICGWVALSPRLRRDQAGLLFFPSWCRSRICIRGPIGSR